MRLAGGKEKEKWRETIWKCCFPCLRWCEVVNRHWNNDWLNNEKAMLDFWEFEESDTHFVFLLLDCLLEILHFHLGIWFCLGLKGGFGYNVWITILNFIFELCSFPTQLVPCFVLLYDPSWSIHILFAKANVTQNLRHLTIILPLI